VSNLNEQQFTSFRGMMLGKGDAPEDHEVIAALNPRVRKNDGLASATSPYGRHWTTEQGTAHRFATNPNAGGYQTLPPAMRKLANTPGSPWGVVLEAHHDASPVDRDLQTRFNDPARRATYSVPYSEHENEVRVWRPTIGSVTAHVVQGRKREVTHSVELPTGHWDPTPEFHQRAIDRWQKDRAKEFSQSVAQRIQK